MIESTKNIVNDILNQAQTEKIVIGDSKNGFWYFYIKLNIIYQNKILNYQKDIPTLTIDNYNSFVKNVDEYLIVAKEFYKNDKDYFMLSDESFEKKLFLDLLSNTTIFDLDFIDNYIKTRTKMLKNQIEEGSFKLGTFKNFRLTGKISKNQSNLEGPYKFNIKFIDENNNEFLLPEITFGIVENQLYIYSVQRKINKNTFIETKNPCEKHLDRYFRKVNKNVDSNSEISKVSPNALVALTIFLSTMNKNGINKIKAPNFMPIRYIATLASMKHKCKTNEDKSKCESTMNKIQNNITNKFTNLLFRYCHHFQNNVPVDSSFQQPLEINIENNNEIIIDDNIIYEIYDIVSNKLKLNIHKEYEKNEQLLLK